MTHFSKPDTSIKRRQFHRCDTDSPVARGVVSDSTDPFLILRIFAFPTRGIFASLRPLRGHSLARPPRACTGDRVAALASRFTTRVSIFRRGSRGAEGPSLGSGSGARRVPPDSFFRVDEGSFHGARRLLLRRRSGAVAQRRPPDDAAADLGSPRPRSAGVPRRGALASPRVRLAGHRPGRLHGLRYALRRRRRGSRGGARRARPRPRRRGRRPREALRLGLLRR